MRSSSHRDGISILHVVPSFGLGGMERIICAIVDGTVPGCAHTILSLSGTVEAKAWINSPSTCYVPLVKPSTRREFFLLLYHQLQELRPQVLMSYNWGATDAIWLGRLALSPERRTSGDRREFDPAFPAAIFHGTAARPAFVTDAIRIDECRLEANENFTHFILQRGSGG